MLPLFDAGAAAPGDRLAATRSTEIAEAHERMESNANVGKIVIDVAP